MSIKKKIVSVVASAAILASMCTCAIASASAWSGKIYFETPDDNWRKANRVAYCHYWSNTGASSGPGWQTADEKMTWEDDEHKVASIEIPEGQWDLVIMSGDSGWQTYDTVMSPACAGDTIVVSGKTFENPVDSKKTAIGAQWKNAGLGAHKVISSLGKVIGDSLIDGETNEQMYENFVKAYDPKIEGLEHPWDLDGQIETGKDFDTICKEIRAELGIADPADNNGGDNNNSGDNNNNNNSGSTTTSGGSTTTSGGSTTTSGGSSSSTRTSNSTGTNQTGDNTPYIALAAALIAAGGVAVFAATRKKKVTE